MLFSFVWVLILLNSLLWFYGNLSSSCPERFGRFSWKCSKIGYNLCKTCAMCIACSRVTTLHNLCMAKKHNFGSIFVQTQNKHLWFWGLNTNFKVKRIIFPLLPVFPPFCVYSYLILLKYMFYSEHSKNFKAEDIQKGIEGKNCMVTGANSGIGYATAKGLASRCSSFLTCYWIWDFLAYFVKLLAKIVIVCVCVCF